MAVTEPGSEATPIMPALEPAVGPVHQQSRAVTMTRVIMALMLREMTTKYGRSPGGYIWAILEPTAMIVVLAFGFSLLMRSPSLGNSFIVFYASGYLAFSQYKTLENVVTRALNYSRGLLRFPVVTWLDAILARFLLNLLTNVLNTILILWGTIIFAGGSSMVELGPMVQAMCLAAILALGIGTLNALLIGLWPVWTSIYAIITRPLMIASAVLYIMEDLPSAAADLLWYNPLVHITGLMRTGVFVTYEPQYISIPYVLGVAMVSLAAGLLFLRPNATTIITGE